VFKRPIPTRLTYRLQSEPIIVRIPQADPSLTIHLHGDELIFDPPYLVFTCSAEASFRITGTALGFKTVSLSRSGPSALLYSGLPLSSPIVIERSFMRNVPGCIRKPPEFKTPIHIQRG
jgi:serine/arginine repetitive matrix protein 2